MSARKRDPDARVKPARMVLRTIALGALLVACSPQARHAEPTPPTATPPPAVVAVDLPASNDGPPALTTIGEHTNEPVAVAFVIDRSGSMTGLPMEMALQATVAAIDDLAAKDTVTVIGFDSQPVAYVKLQDAKAPGIGELVKNIEAGGGTDIFPALDLALDELTPSTATKKQVILLTDGQAPISGVHDLVTAMRHVGITVTTVGLGANFDADFLQGIAEIGSGRFYAVTDPSQLPSVFRKEVGALIAHRSQ